MPVSEQQNKRIALGISLGLHVLILLILPSKTALKSSQPEQLRIPVSLEVVEVPPPPPPPKPKVKKPKKTPKKVQKVAKKQKKVAKKVVEKPPETPKVFPGDRDVPVLDVVLAPVYPKQALNYEWTGTVVVDFEIDSAGKVSGHTIVKSSGHEVLDAAFVRSASLKTFKPKREQGQDVDGGIIRLKHVFELEY